MRFFFVFLMAIFMIGCNHEEKTNETEVTIEEAILESEISPNDVFLTKEFGDETVAFFQVKEELGILHLTKVDRTWSDRGYSSSIDQNEDAEARPVTTVVSKKIREKNTDDEAPTYLSAYVGKVNDPAIDKVIIENKRGEKNGTLINNGDETFWYYVSPKSDGNEQSPTISGYTLDGELVYESK